MLTQAQLQALRESNVETWLDIYQELFETFESVVRLNLAHVKALSHESFERSQTLLSPGASDQASLLQFGSLKPIAELTASYFARLYSIGAEASAEMNRLADKNFADARSELTAVTGSAQNGAAAPTFFAPEFFKSALSATEKLWAPLQNLAQMQVPSPEAAPQMTPQPARTAARKPRQATAKRSVRR